MDYSITYYSEVVRAETRASPQTLSVRYAVLTDRMVVHGAYLGEPHTVAFGNVCFNCG